MNDSNVKKEGSLSFDREWAELLMEAKSLGISISQVRDFLNRTPTSEEPKFYTNINSTPSHGT